MPTSQPHSQLDRQGPLWIAFSRANTAIVWIGRWIRIPHHLVRLALLRIKGRPVIESVEPDAVDADARRRELQQFLAPHALSAIHQTRSRRR